MQRDLVIVILVVGGFVCVATIVIALHGLPEEGASTFNPLSQVSFSPQVKVLKNATSADNTYIYAISDQAAEAIKIAMNDSQIKEILSQSATSAITVAGVQPTPIQDKNGNILGSSSGEVVITSNRQSIGGKPYLGGADFANISGKSIESHQQIWNVLVDMDARKVTDIESDQERVNYRIIKQNSIETAMNMFMPDNVIVKRGANVTWDNNSKLEHNVVGIYRTASGKNIAVDSGFIPPNRSWKFSFIEPGVFQYQCTIHSEEGMKGTIIAS